MSEKIKAVYLDSDGNQHDTKAAAKKANRLIEAARTLLDDIIGDTNIIVDGEGYTTEADWLTIKNEDESTELDERSVMIIEFARAVVSIYGMRDKA